MKKLVATFGLLCICIFCVISQGLETEKKYALKTTNTSFGLSSLHLMDNYLSPLPYSGIGLKLGAENRKYFSPQSDRLSHTTKSNLLLGITSNPAQTASIMYLGLDFGWGMHYHFRPAANLQILTGGLADIDLGLKTNLRNVNNPFNIDFSTNINLSALVIYDIQGHKRTFRLQGAWESPLIGCMFIPLQGASYYEMLMTETEGRYMHFSSIHNKRGLRQHYSIEIPFKNSTWRFGVSGESLKYNANSMFFRRNDITFFIGYTRKLFSFTSKNPAPENFIGY